MLLQTLRYESELPGWAFRRCVERIKTLHPPHQHCLYTNETLRNFIAAHFSNKILSAYDKLVPYAYKADLGRYCLLHKLGGWYFDISIQILHPFNVTEPPFNVTEPIDLLIYRDSWTVSTGIIYSRPNNPIFKTAIDTVVKHCEREYYGITPLCPTGPTVFFQAIAIHGVNSKAIIGDVRRPETKAIIGNVEPETMRAFVLPGRFIHAFGKRSAGGDLNSLGAKSTNNYNELYFSRNIYRR